MNILFFFTCKINTGYAIEKLEKVFINASKHAFGEGANIFFAFTSVSDQEANDYYAKTKVSVIEFDPSTNSQSDIDRFLSFIKEKGITTVVGFDSQPDLPVFRNIRNAGVKNLYSYWGAPMSSINSGPKLWIKKAILNFNSYQPDAFIFESTEMARTAYEGRGISKERVHICNLGADIKKYAYNSENQDYANKQFNIPESQKIIYYSGHMERRKGVHVLLESANLLKQNERDDFHFLIFGNKDKNEIEHFLKYVSENNLEQFVTFGGYRQDLHKILSSAYLGVIASTGWDSFTMSSIEIMSSSVPLITSSLQGLKEITVPGSTGFQFKPGESQELSQLLTFLLENSEARDYLAKNARLRVESHFSEEIQTKNLAQILNPGS